MNIPDEEPKFSSWSYQGKREDQVNSSNAMAVWSFVIVIIFLSSCALIALIDYFLQSLK